jgi:hypothetical protein
MADIDLERRRRGMPWWLWLLIGLLILLLLLWWLWPDGEDEVEFEQAPVTQSEPAASARTEGFALAAVLAAPGQYIGEELPEARVTVASVPTDRGFWIESAGARMLVIIEDQPAEQPKDINPGQTLRLTGGTFRDPSYVEEMQGEGVSGATMDLVRQEEILLIVDERNIEILEAGEPQPGTDPAAGM